MKKSAFLLVSMIICISSCSRCHSEGGSSVSKPIAISSIARSFVNHLSIPNTSLISPQKSWESDVFLVGWKASCNVGYDISILSEKEKQQIIENGLKALTIDADKKEHEKTNRTLLANYYYSKKDFKKAIYWALKGVESGSASCMHILSMAYSNGEQGVVQDFEEGLKWAYLGAACGDKSCRMIVDTNTNEFIFRSDLRELILASQRKATEWMKGHTELFAAKEQVDERIL